MLMERGGGNGVTCCHLWVVACLDQGPSRDSIFTQSQLSGIAARCQEAPWVEWWGVSSDVECTLTCFKHLK